MLAFIKAPVNRAFLVYIALYCAVGVLTVPFYPSFAFPGGDEGTYYSSSRNPWTLISDMFEGYPPMEAISPYNLRLFLTPFSAVFGIFGFTVTGARLVVFAYGVALLFLTFLVGRRLGSVGFAFAGAVLLSLSPQFLYFSHGVRPEGLMALFIVGCMWVVLRRPRPLTASTYLLVGLVSSSVLWVHYNGILLPPIFLVSMLVYDAGAVSRRKLGAYAAGMLIFFALFLLINVWPARDTVQQYGLRPVTFFSTSEIALFQGRSVLRVIADGARYYGQFFQGRSNFEPSTAVYTGVLMLIAVFGVLCGGSREEWFVGSVAGLLMAAMLVIIPNRHLRYVYYVYPFVFLLSMRGLEKIPPRLGGRIVACTVCLAVGGVYVVDGFTTMRQHWVFSGNNRLLAGEIRQLIRSVGDPAEVTVMGGQEFYAAAHDTRYRTFHSLIETKDFATTLKLIAPDIVILHPRVLRVIAACFQHPAPWRRHTGAEGRDETIRQLWRDKGLVVEDRAGRFRFAPGRVPTVILNDLHAAHYARVAIPLALWNDERVAVFLRTKDAP